MRNLSEELAICEDNLNYQYDNLSEIVKQNKIGTKEHFMILDFIKTLETEKYNLELKLGLF